MGARYERYSGEDSSYRRYPLGAETGTHTWPGNRERKRRCCHDCTSVLLGLSFPTQPPEVCPPSGGHFHLSRARMALAGTRNAKALAWNNGSLHREAQSGRDGVRGGQGHRDRRDGEMSGAKRRRQNHTQKQRHRWTRDRADLREVTAAPGRTINSGGPRKKTNGVPGPQASFPLSFSAPAL